MIHNTPENCYLLKNNRSITLVNRFVNFLSIDVNFLYLDFTDSKEMNTSCVNYKRINSKNMLDTIRGNTRNIDHIIVYVPTSLDTYFFPEIIQKLKLMNIPYSILTSEYNSCQTDRLRLNNYIVDSNEIKKSSEVITFDAFAHKYIRSATLKDLIK